jgi:CheY-like chemotaxis protein
MTAPPSKGKRSSRPARRRVLVVADDPAHLELLQIELLAAGYEIEVAADGSEALALARRRAPSAVVSAVVMPSIDGYSLCLDVRDDPELCELPLVLFSSCERGESLQVAVSVGADAFIVRESDNVEAIIEALVQVLGDGRRIDDGGTRDAAQKAGPASGSPASLKTIVRARRRSPRDKAKSQ